MAKRQWQYITNQFEVSTRKNYKKMSAISSYLANTLYARIADLEMKAIYDEYLPYSEAFNESYNKWKCADASYLSATLHVKNLLKQLSSKKIEEWDIAIQNEFRAGSPKYIRILSYRRKPFQKGAYEQITLAVGQLYLSLAGIPALAATRADVDSFSDIIYKARTKQLGAQGELGIRNKDVENKRLECAIAMFAVLGSLMKKYCKRPKNIAAFFELQKIRRTKKKKRKTTEKKKNLKIS